MIKVDVNHSAYLHRVEIGYITDVSGLILPLS